MAPDNEVLNDAARPEGQDRADDSVNACVFAAWQEWHERYEAWRQANGGKRLTPQGFESAKQKFREALMKQYGRSRPDSEWLKRRKG